MRFIVLGAGGIGATIGARLLQAGADVVLIARGAHLDALTARGLHFIAPDGDYQLPVHAVGSPAQVDWRDGDVVLLCVKSQQTEAALRALGSALAGRGLSVPLICAQNGVANERLALRFVQRVYAMVVNLPALHLEPGVVITHAVGGGILDLGRFPLGTDTLACEVADWLTRAGFSCRADERAMGWKYAKLLMNLGNAVQAAVTGTDPADASPAGADADEAMRRIGRLTRAEALACYAAAGIDCASRDEVRARHRGTYRMVDIEGHPRLGGSSWQSVRRGTGDIETDYLNGEIVMLGGLHGVPTPANRICQQLGWQMVRDGLPVGAFSAEAVLASIEREMVV